jgi:hypothetical protein
LGGVADQHELGPGLLDLPHQLSHGLGGHRARLVEHDDVVPGEGESPVLKS